MEDDDENDGALAPGAVPQTKNEIVDADISIPEAEEIGEQESMEKVGEVMAILDNKTVIVKGEASANANRGSESALDSDTLLVFEDRKVLGYVRSLILFLDGFLTCLVNNRFTRLSVPPPNRSIR